MAAAGLCCPPPPGCFEQRAQLCVKSADSGPSPSRPGCLWNFELRCNVGQSGSCFGEAGFFVQQHHNQAQSLCSSLSALTFFHCFIQSSAPHLLQHNIPFASVSSPLFLSSSVSRPVCSFLPPPQTAASQLCLVTETAGFACVCAGQQCYALCIFVHTPLFLRICLHTLP